MSRVGLDGDERVGLDGVSRVGLDGDERVGLVGGIASRVGLVGYSRVDPVGERGSAELSKTTEELITLSICCCVSPSSRSVVSLESVCIGYTPHYDQEIDAKCRESNRSG